MTPDILWFKFRPAGGETRRQQVLSAEFHLRRIDPGQATLTVSVETVRPQDTPDDRGLAGWTPPVLVDLTTDPFPFDPANPVPLDIANAVAGDCPYERAFFCGAHRPLARARIVLKPEDGAQRVFLEVVAEGGDRAAFEALAPL